MRSSRVLALLWLGLWALAPAHAVSAADAMLSEVSSALAAGQYADAVTVASTGLSETGVNELTRGRLLIVRGLARQALGANDDALADFTQVLSIPGLLPEERARALFARGVTLDSLGQLDDAAGDYSAVLRLLPKATYALNNRANVRRRQGRLDEAKRDYQAALTAANPNPQYPWFGLGQIAEAQGDPDAARGYYNRALAAVPGFPLALERLIALGAPAEGPSGLPSDTGIIVLKPPSSAPAKAQTAPAPVIALQPPPFKPVATMAARRPAPALPASSPLRPSTVEGSKPARGGPQAQLGAWRSEQEARDGWAVARDSASGLLDGLAPVILRAEVPGRGTFYRLRVTPTGPVVPFCAGLRQKALACIPARD